MKTLRAGYGKTRRTGSAGRSIPPEFASMKPLEAALHKGWLGPD